MIRIENTALVVVDVQGKLAQSMDDRATLFGNLQRMVKGAQALEIPVILAEQTPEKLGSTIAEVAELLPGIEPVSKTSFSCMASPRFVENLSSLNRNQVLVVGMEAHVCVYQTAIDLLQHGYEVEVVEDAIGSRAASNKRLAVRKMLARGVGLTSVEMALFELMGNSEHPAFRKIQAIIR